MSSSVASSVCRSRGCEKPAVGQGPQSGTSLCSQHLDKENAKIRDQQVKLVKRLNAVRDSIDRDKLRGEQSSLADEVQQVSDMFDALQEKVQQWRDKILSRLQQSHDSVARRLRDALEADECEKEIRVAVDAGDMKKVMELMASVELWLDEACERLEKFDRDRLELRKRQMKEIVGAKDKDKVRSVGDVATGVQYVQYAIDKHLTDMMQHCWLEDGETSDEKDKESILVSMRSIEDLEGFPLHLTCCTSSDGYVGDSSGKVVKKDASKKSSVPLPQPCIFVSYPQNWDHLLVTSLDGGVRLKFCCNLDWTQWICGVHCDSSRQLMFVAQYKIVTVTDLSGSLQRSLKVGKAGQSFQKIGAITGNLDKLFILDMNAEGIFAISKESWQVELVINFSNLICDSGCIDELAVYGTKLLLLDPKIGRIYRVSSVGNQLLGSYPNRAINCFLSPALVAVSRTGIMFVTERQSNTVRVMSPNGSILQTLGGVATMERNDEASFSCPYGVSIVEMDGREILVIADAKKKRLRVYKIL